MPITDRELAALSASSDIISIGILADEIRQRHHGARTTFVRVADVPVDAAPISVPPAAGEVRIVGAPSDRGAAVERVKQVVAGAMGTPVSAFSLADLEDLAAREGATLVGILEDLRSVGLELIAEAPLDRLNDPARSIEAVRTAGLLLARITIEKPSAADPVPQLQMVAALARSVGGIRSFAPLPRTMNVTVPTTGYDDVKRVALARLIAEDVPSIQVDWALYGPKLAQVALTVGADDVDAVSAEEGGGEGRRRAPLEEIRRNIRAAGQEPVERNARFEPIAR